MVAVAAIRAHSFEMGTGDEQSRLPPEDRESAARAEAREANAAPRVVLADDHPFFRRNLADLLGKSGVHVVAEVGSGEAAVEAVGETEPDVVLMDLKMPGVSGLEATSRLTAAYPATQVVVLSVSSGESDVIDAVLAGAGGYVLKDSPREELLAAIQRAAAGEPLVSPRIAAALLRRVREAIASGEGLAGVSLSGRELRILDLIASGHGAEGVAAELGMAAREVRGYTSSVLVKLRVDSAVQAALRDLGSPDR